MSVQIRFLTPLENVNPENDNVDVHVRLEDGRIYSFLVATPNNILWCMENEGVNYYFGTPPVFVRLLTQEYVEQAIEAILTENEGRWLEVYGTLQL
jgi:hypothetical protein